MEKLQTLEYLYTKYKAKTDGMFHNSLWQLMVNEVRRDVQSAFVFIHAQPKNKVNVGIADLNVNGYTPATFSIKSTVSEDERDEMIDELNEKVFGITRERAYEIQLSSMRS